MHTRSMYPSICSLANYNAMLGHVIVKLPAHRYGGSRSGCMWVHVGDAPWIVSNDIARCSSREACRLLLQATHAATIDIPIYRQRLLKPALVVHARRAIYSISSPPSKLKLTPPPHPLLAPSPTRSSLRWPASVSYPYSVTTRCCVTPGSSSVSTCQSRASGPHFQLVPALAFRDVLYETDCVILR